MSDHETWMKMCIELAIESAGTGGGPFASLVVRGRQLVATGINGVTSLNDPTAHAEVQAIRTACKTIGDFRLAGYELYASAEPCPMCMAASYWSRVDAVYYAASRHDAAAAGFDDARLYDEIGLVHDERTLPVRRIRGELGAKPFDAWAANTSRVPY
ncbi:MAG TPA: nucleoside deaminase [Polyangiaceae bacterium]|nr:nucleoside deaminase [Polyangiaceae bacterium]